MSRISVVKGNNRKENIAKAIKLIEKDINKSIKNKNEFFNVINIFYTLIFCDNH